mmetsp:Transcript_56479/g.112117  ORF Transcript_56479/g.112117 Transcript_56479/m.112117 type:complete len:224 (-) Transcript_56479:823-1494(-)
MSTVPRPIIVKDCFRMPLCCSSGVRWANSSGISASSSSSSSSSASGASSSCTTGAESFLGPSPMMDSKRFFTGAGGGTGTSGSAAVAVSPLSRTYMRTKAAVSFLSRSPERSVSNFSIISLTLDLVTSWAPKSLSSKGNSSALMELSPSMSYLLKCGSRTLRKRLIWSWLERSTSALASFASAFHLRIIGVMIVRILAEPLSTSFLMALSTFSCLTSSSSSAR